MREDDRVAIHEAMEQQTISIAKAGITTTLNSRCAVLAAANSVFGRWDDSKGEENIDFMPTILSRFDTIFIVKDEHNERRDTVISLVSSNLAQVPFFNLKKLVQVVSSGPGDSNLAPFHSACAPPGVCNAKLGVRPVDGARHGAKFECAFT